MDNPLLILFVLITLSLSTCGQSYEGIKYQAILRSPGGIILNNQELAVRFTIQQGSIGGAIIYNEMFLTSTSAYGLLNLEIGAGTTTDDFSVINWSNGPYFLETALNFLSGTPWIVMGTSEFLSVPYAFHANTADSLVGGIISLESDPVFTSSLGFGITASDTANWNSIIDTDTQLDSGGIISLGYLAGRTVDTDTQLDSIDIDNLGFTVSGHIMIETDTQLDSIDIANLDFTAGSHNMIDTDTQLDSIDIDNLDYVAEKAYTLGLYPELGGYVFRISSDGKHGLVCETQVQSYIVGWYGCDTLIKNPAYHSLDGQRFSDWRLPTRFELNEIYINRVAIGGIFLGYCFLTSTEYDFGKAYKQNFGLNPTPGHSGLTGKDRKSCGVISVRNF